MTPSHLNTSMSEPCHLSYLNALASPSFPQSFHLLRSCWDACVRRALYALLPPGRLYLPPHYTTPPPPYCPHHTLAPLHLRACAAHGKTPTPPPHHLAPHHTCPAYLHPTTPPHHLTFMQQHAWAALPRFPHATTAPRAARRGRAAGGGQAHAAERRRHHFCRDCSVCR